MNKLLLVILTMCLAQTVFISDARSQNQGSLKDLADAAVKMFTWDIQKEKNGILMFLDVPYRRDNQDTTEHLSLTVAKTYSQERPDFISVVVPDNVSQNNGIFIKFARTVSQKPEFEKGQPLRIPFESSDSEKQTFTARMIGGYATDEKAAQKVDVLQKFMEFDHVFLLFIYPDGSHKSVAVPLSSFKKQYNAL
jgi:hypothetical protein